MKFILASFLCLLCFSGAFAQPGESRYTEKNKESKAASLTLARKDLTGNIVEDIEIFSPKDIPIYCYVDLSSTKSVTVQLNFIAVKVRGIRPNTKIISVSYKTKKGEDSVTFTGKPDKKWIVGSYRVDILLDGKATLSKGFAVENQRLKSK